MQFPVSPFITAVPRGLNPSLSLWENTAFTCVGRRCVLGNSLSGIKGDSSVSGSHGIGCLFGLDKLKKKSRRADSNRLPLLQLRVCGQWLLRVAGICRSRINKRFFVLCLAHYCKVLRAG